MKVKIKHFFLMELLVFALVLNAFHFLTPTTQADDSAAPTPAPEPAPAPAPSNETSSSQPSASIARPAATGTATGSDNVAVPTAPTRSIGDSSDQTGAPAGGSPVVIAPALQTNVTPSPAVSAAAVEQAAVEDKQLAALAAAPPEQKASALVNLADTKVQKIDAAKPTDVSAVAFTTQRLDQNLDQLIKTVATTIPKKTASAKKQLKQLCQTVDITLRTVQLAVPEEDEQDLEITRSKCLQ